MWCIDRFGVSRCYHRSTSCNDQVIKYILYILKKNCKINTNKYEYFENFQILFKFNVKSNYPNNYTTIKKRVILCKKITFLNKSTAKTCYLI